VNDVSDNHKLSTGATPGKRRTITFASYSKLVVVALFLTYLASGMYYIDRNELGVETNFGAIADPSVQPGLHYKLPWPVGYVYKVNVKQMETLAVVDFATKWEKGDLRPGDYYQATRLIPYCITGDNNIVNVDLLIKYTVSNPVWFLFNVRDHELLMNNLAAKVVVHSLSTTGVDEILTFGKKRLEFDVKHILQQELDSFESGISITFIEIRSIKPPASIQSDFDDVINAEVDKKNSVNNAQAYRNKMIPESRSRASQLVNRARSYKRQTVLNAEGQTARFTSQLAEYKKSKRANAGQIYFDTLSTIGENVKRIQIVDKRRPNQLAPYPIPFRPRSD
jgi:modulator of FtsH protease HflK